MRHKVRHINLKQRIATSGQFCNDPLQKWPMKAFMWPVGRLGMRKKVSLIRAGAACTIAGPELQLKIEPITILWLRARFLAVALTV